MATKQFDDILAMETYHIAKDLRYNTKLGINMSKEEFASFLRYKDEMVANGAANFTKLPLSTFDSKHIFYYLGQELTYSINEMIVHDYTLADVVIKENMKGIVSSNILAEVENTLGIENIPTTRKQIESLASGQKPKTREDRTALNIIKAIEFISARPEFNKENLFKLYSIISHDCLDEDQLLKPGDIYRYDSVTIGGIIQCCPADKISESMDMLFKYVNDSIKQKNNLGIIPHIAHYYIAYIHPYFDGNGRTARMVSAWLSLLCGYNAPLFLSEAINIKKSEYYKALQETREFNNDISYFLIYILEISVQYSLYYANLEIIKQHALDNGDSLTENEINYLKRIMFKSARHWFTYRNFIEMINCEMTKQGAFKILNNFVKMGILACKTNSKNEKVFIFLEDMVPYEMLERKFQK